MINFPDYLFVYCIGATNFEGTFSYCTSLLYYPIGPGDIFMGLTLINNLISVFDNCTSLIEGGNLWEVYPTALHTYAYRNCTSMWSYSDAVNAGWA